MADTSSVRIKTNGQLHRMLEDVILLEPSIKIGFVGKPEIGGATGSDAKMVKDVDGEISFDDSVDVAYIGAVHEFGDESRNLPQRSFLRSTYEDKKERISKNLARALRDQMKQNNYDPERALHKVGVWMVGQVKKKFTNNDWPGLQDPTRGGKNFEGTATPLVDTGQLRASIDYELNTKDTP